MRIPRNTLWALCTAIPIQALRYRFVVQAVVLAYQTGLFEPDPLSHG
jgi:hypothetical protein